MIDLLCKSSSEDSEEETKRQAPQPPRAPLENDDQSADDFFKALEQPVRGQPK